MRHTFIALFVASSLGTTGFVHADNTRGGVLPKADIPALRFVEVPGELEFTGQLIVRPKAELAFEQRTLVLEALAPYQLKHYPEVDEFVIVAPAEAGAPRGHGENQFAAQLLATGFYDYVHPNWMCYPLDTFPDDPEFPNQWHHFTMESPKAWDITTGSNSIILAFTDTGIDLTHPDLAPNRVFGFNAVTDLAEVDGGQVDDLNGHGTHVAGCAAAIGNNGIGVAGVGWNMRLMMIRVSDSAGGGAFLDDILQGARWAIENGAASVSSSYSGVNNAAVGTTGTYIKSIGGLYLYAAGNSNTNHTGFDFPGVIIVGASDQADQKAGFSSYGPAVDIFAPGVSILSSCNGGGYCYASGTSMATPVANGVVGMIWSANPALTNQQVEDILFLTCDDLGDPGEDDIFGWGRVNVFMAVAVAAGNAGPLAPIARDDDAGFVIAQTSVLIDVLANDFDPNLDPIVIDVFDAVSALGGTVTRSVGTGPGGRDQLLYTAPNTGGDDSFTYTIRDTTDLTDSATVTMSVADDSFFRRADRPAFTWPGVKVAYYALPALSQLPDFSQLTPYAHDVVAQINFPSTNGNFINSGRADDVGAVFTAYVDVPVTDVYTFYTNSDDGSRLYVGNVMVVDNDGLHGMQERSGDIALMAGRHAVRVDFFERGGGAGVIASIRGGGLGKQVIPASMWAYGSPCPGDTSSSSDPNDPGYGQPDGAVDAADFFYFLDQFASGNLAVADISGSSDPNDPAYGVPDGAIDAADFFYYLDLFVAGCP
ncbi:MAG: S8 family serine peptidase [Phycisphaeraceae bacterium]|nr:S8 family serine peptidase [Phycisphaeraceae bacterium]